MTDDEFEQFARLRGQKAKEFLSRLSLADASNPTVAEIEQIKEAFQAAGAEAKGELFGREIDDINRAKEEKRRGAR